MNEKLKELGVVELDHLFMERVTLVIPETVRDQAIAAIPKGWFLVRSGPYTDAEMFPKVDASRRVLVIERSIADGVHTMHNLLTVAKRIRDLADSGDISAMRDWVEMTQLRSAIECAEKEFTPSES